MCPDDSDSDFGKIRLAGPRTLTAAIYQFSAPVVWRGLIGPVDFADCKSQEVDLLGRSRQTALGTSARRELFEIYGRPQASRHLDGPRNLFMPESDNRIDTHGPPRWYPAAEQSR